MNPMVICVPMFVTYHPLIAPITMATTSRTRNTKKRIRAIPAAAVAIPVKPKSAAMIATTNRPIAQRNTSASLTRGSTSASSLSR
jgi:hypothetical protein